MTAPLKEGWLILWMLVWWWNEWRGGGCCGFMSSDLSSHQKWILSAPLTSLVISPPTTVSYSLFCTAVHFLTCKMRRKRRKNRGQGAWAGGGVSARGLVDRKTFVSLCNVTFNQFYLHWAFCPSRENVIRFREFVKLTYFQVLSDKPAQNLLHMIIN